MFAIFSVFEIFTHALKLAACLMELTEEQPTTKATF